MKAGGKIRSAIQVRGWKIIDLVDKAGLCDESGKVPQRIYNQINGRQPAEESTLRAFARALGMDEEEWGKLSPDNDIGGNYKMHKIVKCIRDYMQNGVCHDNIGKILFFVALSKNKELLTRTTKALRINENYNLYRIMYLSFREFNSNHETFWQYLTLSLKETGRDITSMRTNELERIAIQEFSMLGIIDNTPGDCFSNERHYTDEECFHAAYYCLVNYNI